MPNGRYNQGSIKSEETAIANGRSDNHGKGNSKPEQTQTEMAKLREYQPLKMDPRAVDDLLTQEMDKLSFKDRNDIYEEIHGVASLARDETPELVEQSLVKMSLEIDRIKHKHLAYMEATESYNPYVHGLELRLRFLRCELFDVPMAAVRMLKYLDLTQELFGDLALRRPIQLRDLGKSEMEWLRVGDAQPMPFRDRSGRRLMVAMNNFGLQYPLEVRVCTILVYYSCRFIRQVFFAATTGRACGRATTVFVFYVCMHMIRSDFLQIFYPAILSFLIVCFDEYAGAR